MALIIAARGLASCGDRERRIRHIPPGVRLDTHHHHVVIGPVGTLCDHGPLPLAGGIPGDTGSVLSPMDGTSVPQRRPRFTRGQVFAFSVASFLVVFGVVPCVIGRRGRLFGWSEGRPGLINRLGIVPLALGVAGWAWCLANHYEPGGTVPASLVPESLIRTGPYKFSRNPMYLSEGSVLLGWTLYFGSPALLVRTSVLAAAMGYAVRREERTLQSRFGDSWQDYASKVPRWL